MEDHIRDFLRRDRGLEEAVAALPLPPGADPDIRLRAAYDWIAANVKSTSLLTAEEMERERTKDEKAKDTAEHVLRTREGDTAQIEELFIGMARTLGAEAYRVMAPDRREHFWDKNLLSLDQFDASLVAVRAPGEPLDKARLLDPGSGLPYGEVPWWLTSIFGMVATPEGAREITLWPSQAPQNASESRARVSFEGPGGPRACPGRDRAPGSTASSSAGTCAPCLPRTGLGAWTRCAGRAARSRCRAPNRRGSRIQRVASGSPAKVGGSAAAPRGTSTASA